MKFFLLVSSFLFLLGCQGPTRVSEYDQNAETRIFGRSGNDSLDIRKAVIVDVRPRFEFEMARAPRSFHALASDWELRGYSGVDLEKKAEELRRLLSLHGIDKLTQVGILGSGLKGQGEEFVLFATLKRLGVERILLLDQKKMKDALSAKDLPPIENLDRWRAPLGPAWACPSVGNDSPEKKKNRADIIISTEKSFQRASSPQALFDSRLQVKPTRFPKSLRLNVYSPDLYWAYGLVQYLREQGRQACVL